MAFNLKKVLSALLFSTSQPLSVKDIQAAFTRFHEQAALSAEETVEESPVPQAQAPSSGPEDAAPPSEAPSAPALSDENVPAVTDDSSGEAREPIVSTADGSAPSAAEGTPQPIAAAPVLPPEEAELYQDVPSLITATQIREAMDQIALELRTNDSGLLLVEASEGYRLVTHPRLARWVRILRNEPPPVKLSQSVLETLAVIAYRQPVTRTEIEHIRGVSAEASLSKLLERELIYIVGRADLPGRPLQYGTTERFLEFLGVRSLDELPASDVLSHKQIDEWLQNTTNAKPPTDAEMGLPLELGEGESPNLAPVHVETDPSAVPDQNTPSTAQPEPPSASASAAVQEPTRPQTVAEPSPDSPGEVSTQ